VFKWLALGVLLFVGVAWFAVGRLTASANREVGRPPADLPVLQIYGEELRGAEVLWFRQTQLGS
jgi:hypothetical protein